ncbi:MAG: tetratricopeptide repeat protein [bacterium]
MFIRNEKLEIKKIYWSFFLCISIFLFGAGCAKKQVRTKNRGAISHGQTQKTNVLLITIDTLRPDHLSCYGYKEIKTSNIDSLAKDGICFTSAYTPVPITLPSHATILTGQYPIMHNVRNNGTFHLSQESITLAEIFKSMGYQTGAFVGAFVLDSRFHLNQGFDVYNDRMDNGEKGNELFFDERRAEKVVHSAIEWLTNVKESPFFLWIHCFDPHAPYDPPPAYQPIVSPYQKNMEIALYDGEIAYVDKCLGELFTTMEKLGIYDTTLICFTADHGESINEHGEPSHAIFIYDSTLHVPLIFRYPGVIKKNVKTEELISTVDIAPTILNLLGITVHDDSIMQGEALLGPDGSLTSRNDYAIFCETYYPLFNHRWSALEGLRSREWKYIRAPKAELYNLIDDPRELKNLYKEKGDIARLMEERLEEMKERSSSKKIDTSTRKALDTDTKRKLESLGYIWTAATDIDFTHIGHDYPDPKDMVIILTYLNTGTYYYTHGDYDSAMAEFRKCLRVNPDDVFTHFVMGFLYNKQGQHDMAVKEFNEALRIDPLYINAYIDLGTVYSDMREYDKALEMFNEALKINPDYVEAYQNMGILYGIIHEYDKAIESYEEAISRDSYFTEAYNNLGAVYMAQHEYKTAKKYFAIALEIDPLFIDAYNKLAMLHIYQDQLDEAKNVVQRALELEPTNSDAKINLTTIYIKEKKFARAREQVNELLSMDPNYSKAHNALGTIAIHEELFDEALIHFKNASTFEKNSSEIYYNLGTTLFQLGRIDEAINEYKRAIEIDSKEPKAIFSMGIAYYKKGLIDESIDAFHWALELAPDNAEYEFNLALAYHNQGRVDRAAEHYQKAITIDPQHTKAMLKLGIIYFSQGLTTQGIAQYMKVLIIDPENEVAHINMGVTYYNEGRIDEAIEEFNIVVKNNRENAEAFYRLALCYYSAGLFDKAMGSLREALRIEPENYKAQALRERIELFQ